MKATHPRKILIVRTDRIGDVVLSLPMIPVLKASFPESSISFLVRSYTQDLLKGQEGLESVLLYDDAGIQKPFGKIFSELRAQKFDAVVVTYPTFRLAALMFLARIPVRIGTGYRWYSFLFNHRVYEHRKTAEKHEAEYNLSLLRVLGCSMPANPRPKLAVTESATASARELYRTMGLDNDAPIVLVHPGSGGSARDWRPERFGELALHLSADGYSVLVSYGPGERMLAESVVRRSDGKARLVPRVFSLQELAAFVREADVFVANSTGPLHVAAAVGTPVVAFYPPIPQCSSRRWGPLADERVIFEPTSAACPRCLGGPCQGDNCMETIAVEDVLRAIRDLSLKRRKRRTLAI